jgi:hypothetical protein
MIASGPVPPAQPTPIAPVTQEFSAESHVTPLQDIRGALLCVFV